MSGGVEGAEPAPGSSADEQGPSTIAIVVAVVAVVALLGFGGWVLTRGGGEGDGGDDGRGSAPTSADDDAATTDESTSTTTSESPESSSSSPLPTSPATTSATLSSVVVETPPPTAPPVIVAPTSTVSFPPTAPTETTVTIAVDTTAVDTIAPSSTAPTQERGLDDLVPDIAAEPSFARADAQRQQVIDQLLAAPRNDVASADRVEMLCATVAVDRQIRLAGRWELDGRPLASSDLAAVGPPGFGECVGADGDPLDDGAYQFVAVDGSGASSAAGTFVVGADPIAQQFRNNGRADVCAVLVGPATARLYETYRLGNAPIEPGGRLTIPVADVTQDVRTIGCDDDQLLTEFSFDPSPRDVQALLP